MSTAVFASEAERQQVSSANIGFGFKLLKEIVQEQPGHNVFISPYGASTVLQMACNGAGGQTKSEMQRVLGTAGLTSDMVNAANNDFYRALNGKDTNSILNIANALWYQKSTQPTHAFVTSCQQFFGATVDGIDFMNPNSVDVINAWASEKTHGRISRIADGMIDPLTELFLANAVYFKGKWNEPFEKKNTKDRMFHLRSNNQQKKLPMMEQARKFDYRHGSGYQAVRLAYQGWSLGMYVFLPDPGSSPEKLVSIMNGDNWQRITKPGFSPREGTLVLPKFKLEYGVELNRPLISLGIRTGFSDRADFSGISDRRLFVSRAQQKTFIEVNEEGTEAAAATGVGIPLSAIEIDPPKPFEMIVDRPFLFLIEDRETGTILFMGVIYDPGAS